MTAKANFELHAELRQDQGKGASRRLRRTQDKIPAIVYGGGEAPTAITLDHKKVMHALENKAFYSHILTLHIAGKKQKAVLKDLQRHHFKKAIFHMDFLRVNATDHINMHIPLRFVGAEKAPGVLAGGMVNHPMIDVELRCLASDLPEEIVVDISKLDLDQSIHLSQLTLPAGTELVAFSHGHIADHDHAVVAIHLPRQMKEEIDTPAPEPTETAVVPKGKEAKASAADANATGTTDDKEKGKGKS
ncbi:MAG TPA: 50S ribosomal protein L25/general stress protein Ctc [Gammaproteobacteria bacterium]|nr:50S ribosomal protein L25/general stress protein Ctc [Gammaproteobacteria bacterium]